MADMVASSIVQESVSKMSSFISGKLEEKPSRGDIMARLEMALTRVRFALERTGKWPITNVALLQRRQMFRKFYMEGMDLLNKLKLQPVEDSEEVRQWAAGSSFLGWIARARNLPILSLIIGLSKENISSSVLQKFEWYADLADKFVTDVDYPCPLRHDPFRRYPLESQLLEGKTLTYAGRSRCFSIWPVCLEGRGVEVFLNYLCIDSLMPGKYFFLHLRLRISEGTNIVGTAVRCLQLLSSHFKFVTESAMQEITLLSELHDISYSYGPPQDHIYSEETLVITTNFFRPDPVCCTHNVDSSLGSSFGLPEAVISIAFLCFIPVPLYCLHSSKDEVAINAPSVHLRLLLGPHISSTGPQKILLKFEGREEMHIDGCIQHMDEILRSKAIHFLVGQPGTADYDMYWNSSHGAAFISLKKSRAKRASRKPADAAVPEPMPRATKRQRY